MKGTGDRAINYADARAQVLSVAPVLKMVRTATHIEIWQDSIRLENWKVL